MYAMTISENRHEFEEAKKGIKGEFRGRKRKGKTNNYIIISKN